MQWSDVSQIIIPGCSSLQIGGLVIPITSIASNGRGGYDILNGGKTVYGILCAFLPYPIKLWDGSIAWIDPNPIFPKPFCRISQNKKLLSREDIKIARRQIEKIQLHL